MGNVVVCPEAVPNEKMTRAHHDVVRTAEPLVIYARSFDIENKLNIIFEILLLKI